MAKKKRETGKTPARGTLPAAEDYELLLVEIKERVQTARVSAAVAVNCELVELYWHIGRSIVERQKARGWGKSVVERLARDLRIAFPGMTGFSPRNLWRMRAFHLAYTEEAKKLPQAVADLDGVNLPRPVAEIPWGHNADLLDKVKDPAARIWYARATVEHGWSRNVLSH